MIDNEDKWKKSEEYLTEAESAYASTGSVGYFALTTVIRPIRDRFNSGERTDDLYDCIMDIAL